MGKFVRRVAALGSALILLEVVQKTVVLHHLLTFENQRDDGWFPGHVPVPNLEKSTPNIVDDQNYDSLDKKGKDLASKYVSDPCRMPPGVGGKKDYPCL